MSPIRHAILSICAHGYGLEFNTGEIFDTLDLFGGTDFDNITFGMVRGEIMACVFAGQLMLNSESTFELRTFEEYMKHKEHVEYEEKLLAGAF